MLRRKAGSSSIINVIESPKRYNLSMAAGLVGVVLCSLPFYISILPPINDFSNLVLVARILADYNDPLLRFSEYFTIEWYLAPSSIFYLVLVGLQKVFGYFWDARIFFTLWVVVLWLSVWNLSKVRGSDDPWIPALLVLPLAFTWYVYGGVLPFLMSIPIFALAIAVWYADWNPVVKTALLWILFFLLYGFHIVGMAAAAAVVVVIAISQVFLEKKSLPHLVWAIISVLPAPVLTGFFLLGKHGPSARTEYGDFLTRAVDLVKFTCASLNHVTTVLLFVWLCLLGFAVVIRLRDLFDRRYLIASIAFLFLLGLSIAMPRTFGSLRPAGARLIPFVIVLLCVCVPWSKLRKPIVISTCVLLITGMSFTTVQHTIKLDPGFRDYLSAVKIVQPGKSILPILVNPREGSKWTDPYWFLISAYTVQRGGSNPYVFANPHLLTGAALLKYKQPDRDLKFSFLYNYKKNANASNYIGVSCCYDYVLLWGVSPEIEKVLGGEMAKVHVQGKAMLFARKDLIHDKHKSVEEK